MIRSALVIVSTLILCPAFSQKQEKAFPIKIDGTIRNFSGKKVYIHHKTTEKSISDSAQVNGGKFQFNLKNTEPAMYWFTLTSDINAQPNYIFFADESPVKAKLIGDSILYSSVEAGQAQNDYIVYRNIISSLVMQQQRMQADYQAAQQAGDNGRMQGIQQEFQTLNAQYVSDMKNFIKTHPKSAMSAHIIGNDFNNDNIQIEVVIECLAYLDKSLASNGYVKSATKKVDAIKGTMVGFKANQFTQNTPEGKPVKLSDYKGQYVLIDFWASWCKPCRMENPNVVSAYQRFKGKGFTVLGVSMDSNKDLWTAAIKADNLTWQHVSDLKGWGNEVGILYGVKGIPQNFLIDKEGKIVAKNLRGAELDEKLAEIVK